ncbi:MAG TPA: hypothetical protein EYO73_04540 [Sulfurimonas sp.]|nr:hypothetical protein [Sulfurimonas sp.]
MYFRVLILSLSLFILSACVDNSAPTEFELMRMKMENRQYSNFGHSVENLENRKNKLYKELRKRSAEREKINRKCHAYVE